MNDNSQPTGLRRIFRYAVAYTRIGIWMVAELNPWRRRYGKRR